MEKENDVNRDAKSVGDTQLIQLLRRIAKRGNNAEVKQSKDGKWVVYEVKKERMMVG